MQVTIHVGGDGEAYGEVAGSIAAWQKSTEGNSLAAALTQLHGDAVGRGGRELVEHPKAIAGDNISPETNLAFKAFSI